MRVALLVALMCLSACASEKLALAPPSGVDFTGRWKLDEADSDDPLRVVQSQTADSRPGASGTSGSGGRRGQGGRGGGQGGRGGAGGGYGAAGVGAPPPPAVGALSEALRWPGKELEIKQVAGVVAVTSAGDSRVFQPVANSNIHRHRKPPDRDGAPRDRDMRMRDRDDGPPPVCGWDGKTLVVESGAPDDDHPPFEERYSVSEDGQRLIEVVGFKSSRSAGFTMSRVWERVQ
jgi:hypothetical protein